MTKDEADEKVREAESATLGLMRAWARNGLSVSIRDVLQSAHSLASADKAAEAARAALDKPELLRPEAVFVEVAGKYWCVPELVRADRKHILAQAEKLPQYGIERPAGGIASGFGRAFGMTAVVNEPAILLSDLRNLIQGT